MISVFAYMIGLPTVVSLSFVMNGYLLFRGSLLHNSTTNNTYCFSKHGLCLVTKSLSISWWIILISRLTTVCSSLADISLCHLEIQVLCIWGEISVGRAQPAHAGRHGYVDGQLVAPAAIPNHHISSHKLPRVRHAERSGREHHRLTAEDAEGAALFLR